MSKIAIYCLNEIWFFIKGTQKNIKNLSISLIILLGGLFSLLYCTTYIPVYSQDSQASSLESSIKKAHCRCEIHNSLIYSAPSPWVFGSGKTFQQAKEKARQACSKFPSAIVRDCNEGSYLVHCPCPSPNGKGGSGSAYSKKDALLKAKINCINTIMRTGESRHPPDKTKDKEKCVLVIDNQKYTGLDNKNW